MALLVWCGGTPAWITAANSRLLPDHVERNPVDTVSSVMGPAWEGARTQRPSVSLAEPPHIDARNAGERHQLNGVDLNGGRSEGVTPSPFTRGRRHSGKVTVMSPAATSLRSSLLNCIAENARAQEGGTASLNA